MSEFKNRVTQLFKHTPQLSTTRQFFGLTKFDIDHLGEFVENYRGKGKANLKLYLKTFQSYVFVNLHEEDAFILGAALIKARLKGKTAHEKVAIISNLLEELSK